MPHGGSSEVKAKLRFAAASDPGKRRKNNEDRYYIDPDRGIYAVIDGVGGQAAGETAAGVAVEVMRERLERQTGSAEERLREAITLANNEILRLSRTKPEWAGMACVLTVALVEEDIVTIGHVGDTRRGCLALQQHVGRPGHPPPPVRVLIHRPRHIRLLLLAEQILHRQQAQR